MLPSERNGKIVAQIRRRYTCVRTADYTVGLCLNEAQNKDFMHLNISSLHPNHVPCIIQTDKEDSFVCCTETDCTSFLWCNNITAVPILIDESAMSASTSFT